MHLPIICKTYFFLENPVNPKLVMSEVVEFRPVNISCSVTNVRPAPHITFHIGSDVVAANQTSKREDMMGAYSIRASLDRMERRWNGQMINCCVSNELYTPNTTCTEDRVVSYKCKQKDIQSTLAISNSDISKSARFEASI